MARAQFGAVSPSPAEGEQASLRGYQWQYDHLAALTYDALYSGTLEKIRLADPEVGQVDDLVLFRRGRVDGYQFRSSEHPGTITFGKFTKPQKSRGVAPKPSIARLLADGWRKLRRHRSAARVHFVTPSIASVHDRPAEASDGGPRHFAAFISYVLEPISAGLLTIDAVERKWQPALTKLRDATGLADDEFPEFMKSLHLSVGIGSALSEPASQRADDVLQLSDVLRRRVADSTGVVDLDAARIEDLMDWSHRTQLRSAHQFPGDSTTYAPLQEAISALDALLAGADRGYVALVGPPGAGKSTLLSQVPTDSSDRFAHYFAYVPGRAPQRTAMTADAFLHDVVLMLQQRGLKPYDHLLPVGDMNRLRQAFADHLDAAADDFARSGRRTVVIVDGLDHVERNLAENRGLLAELPNPDELPPGVLFVIGSRTLKPLPLGVRVRLEQSEAVLNLGNYRLPRSSILDICGRASSTASFSVDIHDRVARLSDGHPLALNYLINLLEGADAETAAAVLDEAPPYEGDVEVIYRAACEGVEDDAELFEILSVCSRLRIGFPTSWLPTWTSVRAIQALRDKLGHLFRQDGDGWRFFHDSFRQFAADLTTLGFDRVPDDSADRLAHQRVAELCVESQDPTIAAEELFHRRCAGQDEHVLRLAEPEMFRRQFMGLRSAELIRSDIESALDVAAQHAEVLVMHMLLLSLAENYARAQALRDIDVAGLLVDVGLVDEAVKYGGNLQDIPLVHAYGLLAKLSETNESTARRLFDAFDLPRLDDAHDSYISGDEDEVALSWASAAVRLRPLEAVFAATQRIVDRPRIIPAEADGFDPIYRRWCRYGQSMQIVLAAAESRADLGVLEGLASEFSDQVAKLIERADPTDDRSRDAVDAVIAMLVDLRIQALSALIDTAQTDEDRHDRLNALPERGEVSMYHATMLDLAELHASYGLVDRAVHWLDASGYGQSPAVSAHRLMDEREPLDAEFRYWYLRYLIEPEAASDPIVLGRGGESEFEAQPTELDAAELEDAFDASIRALARIDAATASDQRLPIAEIWTELLRLVHGVRRPSLHPSSSARMMLRHRPLLWRIAIDVVVRYGQGIPRRLSELLGMQFVQEPAQWPVTTRVEIASHLVAAGVDVPWHQTALDELAAVAAEDDVRTRLESTSEVARGHLMKGDLVKAQEVARSLVPIAFGVGYRKDYQFEHWVKWLGSALRADDGQCFIGDADWLARILRAVAPTTERAHPPGAAELPAALTHADPIRAVRLFEYLVRHGVAAHIEALAMLVGAIADNLKLGDTQSVDLAVDIAADIVLPLANAVHPKLTASLLAAADRATGSDNSARVAETLLESINKHAPSDSRQQWRRSLGAPLDDSPDMDDPDAPSPASRDWNTGALELNDGQMLAPNAVADQDLSVEDIISLRSTESASSHFRWAALIASRSLTATDAQLLAEVFDCRTRDGCEVVASLAEAADAGGDTATALRLASDVLSYAPYDGWLYGKRAVCRRAARIAIRNGGAAERATACMTLARRVATEPWIPMMLLADLQDTIAVLDPELDPSTTWSAVRSHLEAIAAGHTLDDASAFEDHGCRWWLPENPGQPRLVGLSSTPQDALAELVVAHVSHPVLVVRDAAIAITARALGAGNQYVEGALARFADASTSHDLLESVGRCVAAARSTYGYVAADSIEALERMLSDHPSQVLRDLAPRQSARPYRPLRPAYYMSLPASFDHPITDTSPARSLYTQHYELLATLTELDFDALIGVAANYAADVQQSLPQDETIHRATRSAGLRFLRPSSTIAAARSAFGRVLGDLQDARLLQDLPSFARDLMRTVDVDALTRSPSPRPTQLPDPPNMDRVGANQSWGTRVDDRIDEYIDAARCAQTLLIAADTTLVLGHSYDLHEKLTVSAAVGSEMPQSDFAERAFATLSDLVSPAAPVTPSPGEPVIVHNEIWGFDLMSAEWLSVRPEIAAALEWTPSSTQPGCWHTTQGDLAAESVWWTDGWWATANRSSGATASQGLAVILTNSGLADVTAAFGGITTHFKLERNSGNLHEPRTLSAATRLQQWTI